MEELEALKKSQRPGQKLKPLGGIWDKTSELTPEKIMEIAPVVSEKGLGDRESPEVRAKALSVLERLAQALKTSEEPEHLKFVYSRIIPEIREYIKTETEPLLKSTGSYIIDVLAGQDEEKK